MDHERRAPGPGYQPGSGAMAWPCPDLRRIERIPPGASDTAGTVDTVIAASPEKLTEGMREAKLYKIMLIARAINEKRGKWTNVGWNVFSVTLDRVCNNANRICVWVKVLLFHLKRCFIDPKHQHNFLCHLRYYPPIKRTLSPLFISCNQAIARSNTLTSLQDEDPETAVSSLHWVQVSSISLSQEAQDTAGAKQGSSWHKRAAPALRRGLLCTSSNAMTWVGCRHHTEGAG